MRTCQQAVATYTQFIAAMVETYDRRLGPILFEPYARDLACRLIECKPCSVLETACGTGILTRAIRAIDARTFIVATDVSEPMLAYAKMKGYGFERIQWSIADAASLPFPAETFDAVACQFGLMFFADKHGAIGEARRVLKPGGTLLFSVWDRIATNPPQNALRQILCDFEAHNLPRFLDSAYGFHRRDEIAELLASHGFSEIYSDIVALQMIAHSADEVALAMVGGSPMGQAIHAQGLSVDAIVRAATAALKRNGAREPFRSTMQAIVVKARAGTRQQP
jgi:ubiquinone/menaquinone biosynthesis C-methylase UbiE